MGRAVADWLALRKGEYLGVMEADEAAEKAAMEETDHLPTRTVAIMVRVWIHIVALRPGYIATIEADRVRSFVRACGRGGGGGMVPRGCIDSPGYVIALCSVTMVSVRCTSIVKVEYLGDLETVAKL